MPAFSLEALERRVLLSTVTANDLIKPPLNQARLMDATPNLVPTIDKPMSDQFLVVGTGPGTLAQVHVMDRQGNVWQNYYPFGAFTGGVNVATGDVNGDGTPDIIVAAQTGGSSNIRVLNGRTGGQLDGALGSFLAYPGNGGSPSQPNSTYYTDAFQGKINIASGDINGDGFDDIIVAVAENGPPHLKVFSGKDGSVLMSTLVYPGASDPSDPNYFALAFQGGVRVAAGDVAGGAYDDIITGAGPGAGPHVKVFDGQSQQVVKSYFAYDEAYSGGVRVAAGDYNGDGKADIITAPGVGVGPNVKVINVADGDTLASFWAYNQNFLGGVWPASGDVNGDGRSDIIVTPGAGVASDTAIFQGGGGYAPAEIGSFYAFDSTFTGGADAAAPWTVNTNQKLYAVNWGDTSTVSSFDSSGVGHTLDLDTPLSYATAAVFDQAGNLYVANPASNSIIKYDSTGHGSQFNVSGDVNDPQGLAFDAAGNLYVANSGDNTIEKFDSSGVGAKFNVLGTVDGPVGLAFDSFGYLYVANSSGNSIEKFSPAGIGSDFSTGGDLNIPWGLAFDAQDNLYVSNFGSNSIDKFDIYGRGAQFNVVSGGDVNEPTGLAVSRAGYVYVANEGDDTIEQFNAQGIGIQFNDDASPLNNPIALAFAPTL